MHLELSKRSPAPRTPRRQRKQSGHYECNGQPLKCLGGTLHTSSFSLSRHEEQRQRKAKTSAQAHGQTGKRPIIAVSHLTAEPQE